MLPSSSLVGQPRAAPADSSMLDREAGQENSGGGSRENLAMLIDAENAPPSFMDEVMRRADRYGQVTHRLAVGSNQGEKWAQVQRRHSIEWERPSQIRTGKNSADIVLTICAMRLLRDPSITGFCIVSSDSDFTPLAVHLREEGKLVIGFGQPQARQAFIDAWDHFETIGATETARNGADSAERKPVAASGVPTRNTPPEVRRPIGSVGHPGRDGLRGEFLDLVVKAAAMAGHREGWVYVCAMGAGMRKMKPDIRYADYGQYPDQKTLTEVLESFPHEIETRGPKDGKEFRVKVLIGACATEKTGAK